MAIEQTFTSNGTLKEFVISEFDFLRSTDLKIYIDPTGGTAKTLVTENTGAVAGQYTIDKASKKITFISSNIQGTLQTNDGSSNAGAPLAGVVTAERVTGIDNPINTFQAGSAITAEQLNDSLNQLRFNIEEYGTLTNSGSLSTGDKGDIDVSNSGNTWTIENGSVNTDKLASNAVTTAKITDSNVTLPKIENIAQDRVLGRTASGSGAVTAIQVDREMIADDAINKDKLTNNAVESDQIKDNAVVQNKIGNDSVYEPRLQISNAGSNGQYLQKQSGNTGGLTWATPGEYFLEGFSMPCRGTKRSFTSPHTAQTWSVDDVSAAQDLTTTYAIATGSSIEYYPPANAKTVIYKYSAHAGPGDTAPLFHARLYFGASEGSVTEVEAAMQSVYLNSNELRWELEWPFRITGSGNGADATLGQMETWTSSKNIHIKAREYTSSNEAKFHNLWHVDGAIQDYFVPPILTITALA